VILIASGSEVETALQGRDRLAAEGIRARVVSMPSWALFAQQDKAYRDEVLPPSVRARVAIEAAHPMGWEKWVGTDGAVIGISRFGASAPAKRVFQELGFSGENVAAKAKQCLGLGDGGAELGEAAAGPTAHGTDEQSA
jgi:transketolase